MSNVPSDIEPPFPNAKASQPALAAAAESSRANGPGARKLMTIGVYGFDSHTFLKTLRQAGVDLIVDVRQRRGVRGPQYAWANSRRLQDSLAHANIRYCHHPEFAPTTELREVQYADDDLQGVGKRNRIQLGAEYTDRFHSEILARADFAPLQAVLSASYRPALFCVETEPAACHRSIVATALAPSIGLTIEHIRPPIHGQAANE